MEQIGMLELKKEYALFAKEINAAVEEVLASGEYILGKRSAELETKIAAYTGAKYGISLANGTDALHLALRALEIGPGDEVITSPFTFIATAEAISLAGATPVFADIDQKTYNLDPKKIRQCITPRTKAIIAVHLFGQPADMDPIMTIAREHQLKVVEDACQAIGAEYKGRRIGSIGDIGCFSFFPSKSLGGFGDGGMAVTNDKNLKDRLLMLRNHGSFQKYIHQEVGINSRLDELQAAILLVKLRYLNDFLEKRRTIAARYTKELASLFPAPPAAHNRSHTFHQYCIEINNRDEAALFLEKRGISTAVYYPVPIHLQEAYAFLGHKEGSFPFSELAARHILALPVHPLLESFEQERVISALKAFCETRQSDS